jgi:hypothetical protein
MLEIIPVLIIIVAFVILAVVAAVMWVIERLRDIFEPLVDRITGKAARQHMAYLDLVEQQRLQEGREKRQFEEERESTAREFKEVVDGFTNSVWDGASPWDELTRTAETLHGGKTDSLPFKETVKFEVPRILKALSVANGSVPNGVARLYHAVFARIEPDGLITVQDCIKKIEDRKHTPPELPGVVKPLSGFDDFRKTHLAATAAAAYASLVIRGSECCSASLAVEVLRIKYLELLGPYMTADFKDCTSSSGRQHSKGTQFNGNCPKCVKYYSVLRLEPDAGEDKAKIGYRNFAKIYHPDRYEGKSERQTAEEELKRVNEAYSHIQTHFEETRYDESHQR